MLTEIRILTCVTLACNFKKYQSNTLGTVGSIAALIFKSKNAFEKPSE